MVAIVSDELAEKIEADALVKLDMIIDDAVSLYKNFNELTLLEKDSSKIVLLRTSVFNICNQLPFDITLIVDYPQAETFFRSKGEANIKELAWNDFKRLQRDVTTGENEENLEEFDT